MSFRYPCRVTLDRYLGEHTAMLAINEVAARTFVENAKHSTDEQSYVFDHCYKHGLLVSKARFDEYQRCRHEYYIVQMYSAADTFCEDFKNEWKEFFGAALWQPKGDKETIIEGVLRNVPGGNSLKPSVYYQVVDYYRESRNCIVHTDSGTKTSDRAGPTRKLHERLVARYGADTGKLFSFAAPNQLGKFSMDDVRLFSWCLQRLAWRISDLGRPTHQQLVDAVFGGRGGAAFRRSYQRFGVIHDPRQRETRQKKAIQFRLLDRFGLTREESVETIANARLPIA